MPILYNQKTLAKGKASSGDTPSRTFTYKGFSSADDATKYKLFDIELIKKDLMNHFYIRKGEKLENPNFGSIIWDSIFENFTQDIKEQIARNVEEIINYDPRIHVNSVTVDSTDQGIQIQADIIYLPFNVRDRMRFDFDKETRTIK